MDAIQIMIFVFAAFAASRVFLIAKNRRLSRNQFIFWSLLWVSAMIISIFPKTISVLSGFFGAAKGISIIVYLSIILLFYFIFKLYVKIRDIDEKITKLTREIAFKNENKVNKKNR